MTELIFRGNDHLRTPYGVFCLILNTKYEFNLGNYFVFLIFFLIFFNFSTPFLMSIWVPPSAAQNLVAPGQGVSKGRNYACRLPLYAFCSRLYGVADFNWFESNAFIADPILIFVLRMYPSNPIILSSLFRHPWNSPHEFATCGALQPGPLLSFGR